MAVTVTGGIGHPAAILDYPTHGIARMQAEALAALIDKAYANSTPTYFDPSAPIRGYSTGYLIVPTSAAGHKIDAKGFSAVVDENNRGGSTIVGGGNDAGQTVLAGDGGLKFTAHTGSTTVVAGGGENFISFKHDDGSNAAYTGGGNDTIIGGEGNTTISAGLGNNLIYLAEGTSLVEVNGHDTIHLGSGSDTIDVLHGTAVVYGSNNASGGGYHLTFVGGGKESTVHGGAGSYDIEGGKGGGVFTGGSAGDNSIIGGTGSVTITGGGAGDTLIGGAGNDLITAGLGKETLGGGNGDNVFNLAIHSVLGTSGVGTTITIKDFDNKDVLALGGSNANEYAISTFQVIGGDGTFKLEDGTTVVLDGFKHLSSTNLKG